MSVRSVWFFTERLSEECSFRLVLYGKILLGVFVPFGSLRKDSLRSVRSVWFFTERFPEECSFCLVLYRKILCWGCSTCVFLFQPTSCPSCRLCRSDCGSVSTGKVIAIVGAGRTAPPQSTITGLRANLSDQP